MGEKAFLDLKDEYRKRKGRDFSAAEYHALVLKRGSLPLSVLESIVRDALDAHG